MTTDDISQENVLETRGRTRVEHAPLLVDPDASLADLSFAITLRLGQAQGILTTLSCLALDEGDNAVGHAAAGAESLIGEVRALADRLFDIARKERREASEA